MSHVWLVATTAEEADWMAAEGFGCESKAAAEAVLAEIKRTADWFYSRQYKIYKRQEASA